jgi:hypothetical protein
MNNATNALYAALTVIFVVGTYGLALSLENILDLWISFRNGEWRLRRQLKGIPDRGIELPSWRVRDPLTSRRPYKMDEEISGAS